MKLLKYLKYSKIKTKHKFFILCSQPVGGIVVYIITYSAVSGPCLLLYNPNMLFAEGHKNYLQSKISISITNFSFHELLINNI
jgi:hypothetical protein